MKLILENFKKFEQQTLNEDADPAKFEFERFPLQLSKVASKAAKFRTRSGAPSTDGQNEEDVINLSKGSMPVGKLKPSQGSMNIDKALGMVIAMLDPDNKFSAGGDLGAFISKDGYIMDGHHRWIATSMIDPSLQMGGIIVDFPAKELVAVLNSITKGLLGVLKGKKATGDFKQFQPEPLKAKLKQLAAEGNDYNSPEKVVAVLEKFTGQKGDAAVEAAANKFSQNLSKITVAPPSWAPQRPDMPVIDPDIKPNAIKLAVMAMESGAVDVNPPYGDKKLIKKAKQDVAKRAQSDDAERTAARLRALEPKQR